MKLLLEDTIKRELMFHNIESQIDEDYPTTWNIDEFKSLKSFNKRVKYCEANLRRISSGSSRIVYKIDDTKVLKLAKNKKGIEQNSIEINWKDDGYYYEILANVLEYDPNNLWVEMELARKVTPNIFKTHFNFSFEVYSKYISAEIKYVGPTKENYLNQLDDREKLEENEFIMKIISFIHDNDAPVGDFCRLSTYGLVNREGSPNIVLIDFGLTSDIYDSYYK